MRQWIRTYSWTPSFLLENWNRTNMYEVITHYTSCQQCRTVSTVSTVSTVIARCYLHLRWYFFVGKTPNSPTPPWSMVCRWLTQWSLSIVSIHHRSVPLYPTLSFCEEVDFLIKVNLIIINIYLHCWIKDNARTKTEMVLLHLHCWLWPLPRQ